MAIVTFNPNASAVDGIAFRGPIDSNWAGVRDGAGSSSDSTSTSAVCCMIQTHVSVNVLQQINRGFFLFDTSSLTTSATITAATLRLYVTATADAYTQSVSIALPTPASNTVLASSDYDIANWSMVRQATDLTIAGLTTSAYNTWTLNATGLGNISKTGITKFGTVCSADLDNTTTGSSAAQESSVTVQFTEGANKPQLVVTFTGGPLDPSVISGGYSYFM